MRDIAGDIVEADTEHRDPPVLEDHEAHAAGAICGRCGKAILASQEVRHRGTGNWVHEVCPPAID